MTVNTTDKSKPQSDSIRFQATINIIFYCLVSETKIEVQKKTAYTDTILLLVLVLLARVVLVQYKY
jgi:hypothetical protein